MFLGWLCVLGLAEESSSQISSAQNARPSRQCYSLVTCHIMSSQHCTRHCSG